MSSTKGCPRRKKTSHAYHPNPKDQSDVEFHVGYRSIGAFSVARWPELCRCVRRRCAVQNCNPTMCNTSGIPSCPPAKPNCISDSREAAKIASGAKAAQQRRTKCRQAARAPRVPPPRTLSISPLQRDDETAELEARVLRLARAARAAGAPRAATAGGRSRGVQPQPDPPRGAADDGLGRGRRARSRPSTPPLRHLRRRAAGAEREASAHRGAFRQARCRPRSELGRRRGRPARAEPTPARVARRDAGAVVGAAHGAQLPHGPESPRAVRRRVRVPTVRRRSPFEDEGAVRLAAALWAPRSIITTLETERPKKTLQTPCTVVTLNRRITGGQHGLGERGQRAVGATSCSAR